MWRHLSELAVETWPLIEGRVIVERPQGLATDLDVFGPGVTPTLRRGIGLCHDLLTVVQRAIAVREISLSEIAEVLNDPTSLLADTSEEELGLIGAGLRSSISSLGISMALLQRAPLAEWLAEGLVDVFVSGIWAELRLYASLPDLEVSEDLVPLSARIEVAANDSIRRVTVGGRKYRVVPPLRYVLRTEDENVITEAEEFHLHAFAESEEAARDEIRCDFVALLEGYAFEDDSQLAPSGLRLKQQLLARLRPI